MDKSLIFKHFLTFGAGVTLALFVIPRTPTIQEKIVEVNSAEDSALIESLQKQLHLEKYTSSMLKRDIESFRSASNSESKDIETVTTVTKPDGTKIVTEKKDKSKTASTTETKEKIKTETVVVEKVVEKEVIKYEKELETSKSFSSKESEYTFNSSFSLGVSLDFDFTKSSFQYSVISLYQFSPMFSVFSTITLPATLNSAESIGFGFAINF